MNCQQRRILRRKGKDGGRLQLEGRLLATEVYVKSFPRCPEIGCGSEVRKQIIQFGQTSYKCMAGHWGPWKDRIITQPKETTL